MGWNRETPSLDCGRGSVAGAASICGSFHKFAVPESVQIMRLATPETMNGPETSRGGRL